MADTKPAHLPIYPEEMRLGGWACQDMLTVDIAPGKGMRSQDGYHYALSEPTLALHQMSRCLAMPSLFMRQIRRILPKHLD